MKTPKRITSKQPPKNKMERDAALFYPDSENNRTEPRAFQKASLRSLRRD
jgi:hypothetical protein